MPKLNDRALERNQVNIEDAALRVFIRQGFHGTTVRDIAQEAGVSLGNIYNYYGTKEELYVSLARRYQDQMNALQLRTLKPLLGRTDPEGLQQLATTVRDIVYKYPDYWQLMYIDVTEFGNKHFAHSFRQLSKNLEKLAGGFESQPPLNAGVDRSLAFTAIYLQFFTYFLVEKLFGGKQHLGLPEDQAIAQLIRIFTAGVGGDGSNGNHHENGSNGSPSRRRQ